MNDVLLGVFVTVAVLMVFNLGSCVGYQEGVRDDRDGVVKCVVTIGGWRSNFTPSFRSFWHKKW